MDPRIDALVDLLLQHRADLERAVATVPANLRDARPADGRWSVAQVLEHLVATERGITRLLDEFLAVSVERVEGERFDEPAFSRTLDMPFFLDRSRRVRGSQPAGEMDADEAWAALAASRSTLLATLERARGRKLEDQSLPHPATGAPLDGYQWIAFAGLHEARHALQVLEARDVLEGGDQR